MCIRRNNFSLRCGIQQIFWNNDKKTFTYLEAIIRMPACQDCRFYASVDEQKGECFSLGFEVRGKTDSKKCPERAFRPNKGSKLKKSGAPTRF